MRSSHEIEHSSSNAPGVESSGAMPARRYRVRRAGAGGVLEHGEAPQGLTGNTGDPSCAGRQSRKQVATGIPTTRARGADDGTRVQRRAHRHCPIPGTRLQTKCPEEAHRRLSGRKAPGIDGETKAGYDNGLQDKLDDLTARVQTQSYRAPPVRRVEIPKPDGSSRPIGIPTYEDKILQKAFVLLVEPLFEKEFHDGSYGYRPGRTAHDALRAVDRAVNGGHHWIIELDIKGYFESIPHKKLREMFGHRIKDGVLNRLVLGWLKAGVLKEGQWESRDEGTPQGGIVSPLLANLYLHHVLDQWIEEDVKPRMKGSLRLVRYADDAVLCFTSGEDARRVFRVLDKRFGKYGLTLHPDKTRLLDFRSPRQRPDGASNTFGLSGLHLAEGSGLL